MLLSTAALNCPTKRSKGGEQDKGGRAVARPYEYYPTNHLAYADFRLPPIEIT